MNRGFALFVSEAASQGALSMSITESTAPASPVNCGIDEIIVGERHRRDMGDIDALAASIDDIGLLHPVVVTPDLRLVAGKRRLHAVELLGWKTIPVTVVDLDAVVRGEFAENTFRKDFTPSELVAIGEQVERIEREHARKRKAHGGRPGKLPERQTGDTRDRTAAQLGVSGRTFEKAKAVVAAARAEPERGAHRRSSEAESSAHMDARRRSHFAALRALWARRMGRAGRREPR